MKQKHKAYLNNLFVELDNMYEKNPRGYMNLVKSIRSNSFDKKPPDDTSFVAPQDWVNHFKQLLGPDIRKSPQDIEMDEYVSSCYHQFETEFQHPITKHELITNINSLKNNKASSFDSVTNEMLKASKSIIGDQLLLLFNTILDATIYPSIWRLDILSPLHKSGDKNIPGNFRGISVSSCLGKLFNKIIFSRLEKYCTVNKTVSIFQGSGKKKTRTADHLMIVRFLIDKYVKNKGEKLYVCFVDLQKCYDTVPRTQLFFKLLKEYSFGGKFLKIIQEIYKNNQVFIKTPDGLLEPFTTTVGVKQGCTFSPLLYNLYSNDLDKIFDNTCDPAQIDNIDINCITWADDLLLISKSAKGLQEAMKRTSTYFNSLGLSINYNKTKVMIFNKRGININNIHFFMNGKEIEIANEYKYLGIQFKPSGSMVLD